jgi:hypothetical protein
MRKKILVHERLRKIEGSFAFIEHRFLRDGFLATLTSVESALYLFLALAADRHGLSFYSFDRICSTLTLDVDDYIDARNSLIDKDLIAFDGYLFQVLSLPPQPRCKARALLKTREDMDRSDPATIGQICAQALGKKP